MTVHHKVSRCDSASHLRREKRSGIQSGICILAMPVPNDKASLPFFGLTTTAVGHDW